ncbi:MAG: hypothetical protein JSS81_18870 [Acidobacteria bacterium]|nr:hypothetical protein [Acidobacteriota bacterium]
MRNYQFIEPTFGVRNHRLAICQSIYDANAFNIRNWKNNRAADYEMLPELVTGFLKLLDELQIDFCIVGGIAYLAYIQDRNTKDLDILISVTELERIRNRLTIVDEDANFTNAEFEGMRIDFLKTSNALFDYVKHHETALYEFSEGRYPIATVAGLVLMRFDAIVDLYQKGNFNKILRYESDLRFLTVNYEIDWERIWTVSRQFFTDGQIDEFRKMVAEWQKPRVNPFLK